MTGQRLAALALLTMVLTGCTTPGKRLNSPPHGRAEVTTDLQGTFTYMADNATLTMMTVNDNHFVPGRAMLNSQGRQRLDRLASLIDAYGGQIRFNTDSQDHTLNGQRMNAIRAHLAETGVATGGDLVVMGMPGGEGSLAEEAILIRKELGMYKPGGSGAAGPGAAASSSGN